MFRKIFSIIILISFIFGINSHMDHYCKCKCKNTTRPHNKTLHINNEKKGRSNTRLFDVDDHEIM